MNVECIFHAFISNRSNSERTTQQTHLKVHSIYLNNAKSMDLNKVRNLPRERGRKL